MASRGQRFMWLRRFAADESGGASLEFVATLPLLLVCMVFSAQYGEALAKREALDSAVRDAVHLIANAPVKASSTADCAYEPEDAFVTRAKEIIAQRVKVRPAKITFSACILDDISNGELVEPFYPVEVKALAEVDLGLLAIIDLFDGPTASGGDGVPTGLTLRAADSARYSIGRNPS